MKFCSYFSFAVVALFFGSCIGEEPLEMECDIEEVALLLENPKDLFYDESSARKSTSDTQHPLSYGKENIVFTAKYGSEVGLIPVRFTLTKGAIIERETMAEGGTEKVYVPFHNGDAVDFSGEQKVPFRVTAEDRVHSSRYVLSIRVEKLPYFDGELFFDLEESKLDPANNNRFYIWPVADENVLGTGIMGDPDDNGYFIWRNGNPGYKLSKSSAKPDDYPTVPVTGDNGPSVPGNACVKLETKDTGSFGAMVNMRIAAGSFFTGMFDVTNALKDALKATVFGSPFCYKPISLEFDAKLIPAEKPYQDRSGKPVPGIVDEPDVYMVMYKNHDEQGNVVRLDGNNLLTSPLIVGKTRLPHNYTPDGKDQESSTPKHGLTSEWKHIVLPFEYYEEINPEQLLNKEYSLLIGFASSWQGAYFRGAVGTKLYVDNIRVKCEKVEEPED